MPVFNDSENIPAILDEGDYIFEVVNAEIGLQARGATIGSEFIEPEFSIQPSGKKITEKLIDHKSTAWKIDTFLKSAGVQLNKGEAFEFRKDVATSKGVRWVNVVGLRGWCRVVQEPYWPSSVPEGQRTDANKRMANKIAVFYTDREKLPAREVPEEDQPF